MKTTAILSICFFLVSITCAKPAPQSNGDLTSQLDSYSNIPIQNQSDDVPQADSPLALELLPPTVVASAAPHIYYMGSDGIAVPAEGENYSKVLRKRESDADSIPAVDPPKVDNDETMVAENTFIIGPSSGRGCGSSGLLGFRPARAYYARRYHKYPWNYH